MTENELLAAHGLLRRHCSRVLREHALAWPCAEPSVVTYQLPDGTRIAWCEKHRADGEQHARLRGWERVETLERVA